MERRKNDRFKVPGAQVVYKLPDGESSLVPIIDLTNCSIRFITQHIVDLGTQIELEIKAPKNENISLKGNVVRLSDPHQERMTGAVVQFLPFGTINEYNDFHSYNQLKKLIQTFNKH